MNRLTLSEEEFQEKTGDLHESLKPDTEGALPKLVRRLGRFHISRRLILERPEQLKPLFAECVVLEAQLRWERDCVEYLAMSERFDPVPENLAVPDYEITFRMDDEGRATMHEVKRSLSA